MRPTDSKARPGVWIREGLLYACYEQSYYALQSKRAKPNWLKGLKPSSPTAGRKSCVCLFWLHNGSQLAPAKSCDACRFPGSLAFGVAAMGTLLVRC